MAVAVSWAAGLTAELKAAGLTGCWWQGRSLYRWYLETRGTPYLAWLSVIPGCPMQVTYAVQRRDREPLPEVPDAMLAGLIAKSLKAAQVAQIFFELDSRERRH